MDKDGTSQGGVAARLRGVSGRTWAGLALAALAVLFIVQNREEARLTVLAVSISAPLWVTLLITVLVGIVIGMLLARNRQRSK